VNILGWPASQLYRGISVYIEIMNNLMFLARFGGGRGSVALLFFLLLAVVAVAIFSASRSVSEDKK
jgi:hypothetical protein